MPSPLKSPARIPPRSVSRCSAFSWQGHIVNVTSRGAYRGEPEAPAYGAAKAGEGPVVRAGPTDAATGYWLLLATVEVFESQLVGMSPLDVKVCKRQS